MPLDQDLTEFTTVSQAITSFNFTDVVSGTSYLRVFGTGTKNNGSKILTQSQLEGDLPSTPSTSNFEVNFDLKFEKTLIVEGILFVAWSLETDTGTTNTSTVEIFHVDAADSETSIGTEVAGRAIGTALRSHRNLTKFEIAATTFKKGDTLRITVGIWARETIEGGGGLLAYGFGHDPKSRTSSDTEVLVANEPTDFQINIPFELNI